MITVLMIAAAELIQLFLGLKTRYGYPLPGMSIGMGIHAGMSIGYPILGMSITSMSIELILGMSINSRYEYPVYLQYEYPCIHSV